MRTVPDPRRSRVPASDPAVTTRMAGTIDPADSGAGVLASLLPDLDRRPPERGSDAIFRSARTTLMAASTKSQSRIRNPTLVSWRISAGMTVSGPVGLPVEPEDDGGMTDPDDIAVGELPGLNGGTVDRRPVGGSQIVHDRDLAVEVDVDVSARYRGVRSAERCILAATDDVGPALQLICPVGAVVDTQHSLDVDRLLLIRGRRAVPLAIVRLTVLLWLSVLLRLSVALAVVGLLIFRLPGGGLIAGGGAVTLAVVGLGRLSIWIGRHTVLRRLTVSGRRLAVALSLSLRRVVGGL